MINDNDPTVFAEVQKRAEGKIKCPCGNRDWTKFVYLSAGSVYIAGCKLCGKGYTLKEGEWVYAAPNTGRA